MLLLDRRLRDILILWRQHTFLTLAGVEPIYFAISIDERPSAAICLTRRRLSGVNRIGRLAFFVLAISRLSLACPGSFEDALVPFEHVADHARDDHPIRLGKIHFHVPKRSKRALKHRVLPDHLSFKLAI